MRLLCCQSFHHFNFQTSRLITKKFSLDIKGHRDLILVTFLQSLISFVI